MKRTLICKVNDFLVKFRLIGLLGILILVLLANNVKSEALEIFTIIYIVAYFLIYFWGYYSGKRAILVYNKKIKQSIRKTSYYKSKIKFNFFFIMGSITVLLLYIITMRERIFSGNPLYWLVPNTIIVAYILIVALIYAFIKAKLPDIDKVLIEIFDLDSKDNNKFHVETRNGKVPYTFEYKVSEGIDKMSVIRPYKFGECSIFGTITFRNNRNLVSKEVLEKVREKYYFLNIQLTDTENDTILHIRNLYIYKNIINSKHIVRNVVSMCELANDIIECKKME